MTLRKKGRATPKIRAGLRGECESEQTPVGGKKEEGKEPAEKQKLSCGGGNNYTEKGKGS